jgi:alpha-methylacyl-CoA racemase
MIMGRYSLHAVTQRRMRQQIRPMLMLPDPTQAQPAGMDTDRNHDNGHPLAGVRVLDLSRLLPGPYCSLLLAGMGADVIKVETPLAGDYARLAPDELGSGGVFEAVNRGKRSIALDYRKPEGREVLLRLVETADVFLEPSRPGQLERRGLGADAVRRANPAIVYCSLSGFGQISAHRAEPAHDINYLATSGVLAMLGAVGSAPSPPGLQLADIAAGTLAAARISAALVAQQRSGHGCYIDAAVIDPLVSWLETLGSGVGEAGTVAGPLAGAYPC